MTNKPAQTDPPLRILHLEDNSDDALLVQDQLAHDELAAKITVVVRQEEFIRALSEKKWDLILADYRLPDFTGLDALRLVREKDAIIPFILMSATLGEHAAIESLKSGATDYILKHNRER